MTQAERLLQQIIKEIGWFDLEEDYPDERKNTLVIDGSMEVNRADAIYLRTLGAGPA